MRPIFMFLLIAAILIFVFLGSTRDALSPKIVGGNGPQINFPKVDPPPPALNPSDPKLVQAYREKVEANPPESSPASNPQRTQKELEDIEKLRVFQDNLARMPMGGDAARFQQALGTDPLADKLARLLAGAERKMDSAMLLKAKDQLLTEFKMNPERGIALLSKSLDLLDAKNHLAERVEVLDAISKIPGKSAEAQTLALKEFAGDSAPKDAPAELVTTAYRVFISSHPAEDVAVAATVKGLKNQTDSQVRREMVMMFRAAQPGASPQLDAQLSAMGIDPKSVPDPWAPPPPPVAE